MKKYISIAAAGVLCASLLCSCQSNTATTGSTASASASDSSSTATVETTTTASSSASDSIVTEDTTSDTSAEDSTADTTTEDTTADTTTEDTTAVANPVTTYASFDELAAALPDVTLYQPASDAVIIAYQDISGQVAEIQFTYNDNEVDLRAAACADAASALDISGASFTFGDPEVLDEATGLTYEAATDGDYQRLTWYDEATKTQYCLAGTTKIDAETFKAAIGTIIVPIA